MCEPGRGAQVNREALTRATARLRHRGPDGEGFYFRDNVGFGHRRLSIIDLAGGSQPIFNEDGTVAIVFNGEIYNYRELQKELEGLGHRFASSSDTEAIVHAYEEWGVDCLRRFVGMFAFAIWDERDRSAFIARDRLGKKPLFYHAAGGRLVFASELKALLEHDAVPREVDLRALDDYLAYSYVPSDRCIFGGVQKLPPGHWMRWKDGSLSVLGKTVASKLKKFFFAHSAWSAVASASGSMYAPPLRCMAKFLFQKAKPLLVTAS